jgi:hypothetical protein
MKEEGGGGDAGFVRADQIDLKSLDEQLERHLTRAWTMEKRKEEASAGAGAGARQHQQSRRPRREDWEIDPAKLVVKGVIARGTFGTVHRGIYDAHDVAGSLFRRRRSVRSLHPARARLVAPESPRRTASAAPVGDGGGSRACAPDAPPPFCCLFWQIAGVDGLLFLGGFPCCEPASATP